MRYQLNRTDSGWDVDPVRGAVLDELPVTSIQHFPGPRPACLQIWVDREDLRPQPMTGRSYASSVAFYLRTPSGRLKLLATAALGGTGYMTVTIDLPAEEIGRYAIVEHDVDRRTMTSVLEWDVTED